MKIYVDLDGVLANFDKAAEQALGTENIYKYEFVWGPKAFWDKINKRPFFFQGLEKMSDAGYLWGSIEHLKPVILTALPSTEPERVDQQKRAWVNKNFPGTEVITCVTKDKPKYCKPGDILIDDRAVNRTAWLEAGGTYIIHKNARDTVVTLQALGII